MPELPDVAVLAETLNPTSKTGLLNREIASVDLRDPGRLRGSRTEDLVAALTGYHVERITRHGKVLGLKISCGWTLAVHFGMTGTITLYDTADSEPDHARLVLRFTDGGFAAFDDTRRLGWIELTDDLGIYLRQQDIGPDALSIGAESFAQRLAKKHGALKTVLLNQDIVAGIGNVYADEILFQAGLAPDRKAESLTPDETKTLFTTMQQVLTKAIEAEADPARFPADWLTPHRQKDAACPKCGEPLETEEIGGRKSYICRTCQI